MESIIGFAILAALRWAVLVFLWKWLGPIVLNPCPQFTTSGACIAAGWFALRAYFVQYADDSRYKKRDGT